VFTTESKRNSRWRGMSPVMERNDFHCKNTDAGDDEMNKRKREPTSLFSRKRV